MKRINDENNQRYALKLEHQMHQKLRLEYQRAVNKERRETNINQRNTHRNHILSANRGKYEETKDYKSQMAGERGYLMRENKGKAAEIYSS